MKVKFSAGLAIVYKGKVLLAHTTGRKWSTGYGIPKGGIEKGESKIEAAIRETHEEVGIKVPKEYIYDKEYNFVVTSKKHKYNKIVYYYVVEIEDLKQLGLKEEKVPKKQLQLEEIDWAGFMGYREASKKIMHSQKPVIDALRQRGLLEGKEPMKKIKLFEEFTSIKQNLDGLKFAEEPSLDHIEVMDNPKKQMKGFPIEDFYNIPFPKNSSIETFREIKDIRKIEKDNGFIVSTDDLYAHFEEGLEPHGIKFDKKKWEPIINKSVSAIYHIKYHYNRPRPADVAIELGIFLGHSNLESAQTPAYPSGHSAQGRFLSLLLANEHPEKREEILKLGFDIGKGRLMAKVHYGSDHEFGLRLGEAFYEYWNKQS